MRFVLAVFCVFLLFAAAQAQTIDPIVSIAPRGNGWLVGLDASGNFFDNLTAGENWVSRGNIPDLAGRPATAPFVAINFRVINIYQYSPAFYGALTSNGDYYWQDGGSDWFYGGNVVEQSGRPTGGLFVSLCLGGYMQAMTSMGERYHCIEDGPSMGWHFVDSIPADIGVVATEKESLGGLKSMFR